MRTELVAFVTATVIASAALADAPTVTPTARNAAADLGGTSWRLVRFEGSDDTTLTPDDRSRYTIAFEGEGRLSARIDCNRGRGTWKSAGPRQLELGPLALTRAKCPPGSLHDRIVKDWEYVRSYTIKDGHLFLALMADGGIYELEPIEHVEPAAPKPPPAPAHPAAAPSSGIR
jgi:para-nitrobenzyl esterase